MKTLRLFVAALFCASVGFAQLQTPAPSPAATLTQVVGLTDVAIDYSRPAMRGRTIFGDLVPYGTLWRTGANARTKVTFGDDVKVGGTDLKAGTYAIFSIPQQNEWEVIFYTEYQGGGAPAELDESKVAARVKASVFPIAMDIQSFTITVDDITTNSAVIGIMWEKTYVAVPFEVPTDAKVSDAIDKVMSGPGAGDYYQAAVYYLSEGKDIGKAKEWMDKAMSMVETPRFWQLRQQSLIYAAAGDKKGAIELAKKSLMGAEEAGNADYIKMNKDSLMEWGAK
ncbi:DUF2911 domain-containing protein [Croceivirga thetidis]|uniref:DUF2911 domain-containing protein n=1 Tax=Croceivirga thetidis TaxID=2721623 RepID=A0ABX1GR63_9FLAO|nr:DUF2911 domain-containing protein [Croceivirga thetidis]NKI32074.1 DUF2911 domain-containing protein [Croceivirga thetidis]